MPMMIIRRKEKHHTIVNIFLMALLGIFACCVFMALLSQLIDQEIALRAAQMNLWRIGIDLWSKERDLEEISRMIKDRQASVKLI